MATREEHIAQAQHNEAVALFLAEAGYYEWAMTALFYAALHLVQAYFVSLDIPPRSHALRARLLSTDARVDEMLEPYSRLKILSEYVRYDCGAIDEGTFADVRDGDYAAVRSHLAQLLR